MKTVAERAAELGLDKKQLVQALKLIGRNRVMFDKRTPTGSGWYRWRTNKPLLSLEQAALALGVDLKDAEREIKLSYPHQWTRAEMLTAMFEFHKREGRWPRSKEYKLDNNLPPLGQWRWHVQRDNWNINPRDQWERWIAADRRCTPEMALALRNVLARKEAIDRIGFDKLVKGGVATLIDEHPEFGALYRLPGEMPKEPMVLLKVVNSTPEPDGTFTDYYLRVPPSMTNVQEALKWTFNGNEALGSQPYEPLVQT